MHFRPAATDGRAEFVARERELAVLGEHRREAAAGHGRIVLVGGDAGIGKSRLLRAFEGSVAATRSIVATAHCVEFVQTPLGPLRELLQGLERKVPAPRDPATRALIERLTFERNTVAAPAQPAGWLFESIDAALARAAQRATVVLLVEDLHWADRSTLGFLEYLAHRIGDRRLLVVATHRGEDVAGGPAGLGGLTTLLASGDVSNLTLRPLDERAMQGLIENALPEASALDPATVADIVRRSQGNPFFAEELVKHACDVADAEGERLPLSIRAAVLARAAQLTDEAREILSLAAVLGERFSIDRLVKLSSASREATLRALERARALNLVYDQRDGSLQLAFRHALTQEVLYGELLAERVRPLHETIGLELERSAGHASVSVELAHHWWRAGDRERAARYAELAGDAAFAIGAMADAISYYERALAQGTAGNVVRANLEHKVGVALGELGRLHAGIRRLERAGELFREAGDFEGFGRNVSALGGMLYNVGETTTAIDLKRRAIEELATKLPARSVDLLRARMGYDCVAALDFETALGLVSGISEPIEDALIATHAYQARFKVAAMRGDIDGWRGDAERALAAARRINDDGYRLFQAHVQIGLDAVALGEIETAREHFSAAASPASTPYAGSRSLAFAVSSFEHSLRGDFANAAALLARAESASEQNYARLVHIKAAQLALVLAVGDDARIRRQDVDAFLHHGVERGMKLAMGLLGGPYAWVLGARGDADEAAAWVHRIGRVLPGPHRFAFAFLAAAQYGLPRDVAAMRPLLADAASRPQDRVNKALLALFDAFAAQRGLVEVDGREAALDAAARFEAIGWPWLAARGFEAGGEPKRALEAYRALGAVRDVRRMEAARGDATAVVLSPREREVADLAAKGHSNDEIAQMLHISLRTVEKHVSSALAKLHVRSRVQLSRVLAPDH